MIQLTDIASNLNSLLNNEISIKGEDGKYKYPTLNGQDEDGNEMPLQEFYMFNIVADTAEYKKAEREQGSNTITRYINGIVSRTGGTIEGVSENAVNSTLSVALNFAVPVRQYDGSTPEYVKSVSELVNNVFALNMQGVMYDGTEPYQYGMAFTPLSSGDRRQYPLIGDCFSFTIFMTFYFVQSGVNSTDIELYINDSRIYPLTYGFTRAAQQETVVNAGSSGLSAINITTATVMTFSFVVPMRNDYISKEINNQIDNPNNKTYNVKKVTRFASGTVTEKVFSMQFRECSENGEGVKNVGLTATMSEV